jgi:hypothetical protein
MRAEIEALLAGGMGAVYRARECPARPRCRHQGAIGRYRRRYRRSQRLLILKRAQPDNRNRTNLLITGRRLCQKRGAANRDCSAASTRISCFAASTITMGEQETGYLSRYPQERRPVGPVPHDADGLLFDNGSPRTFAKEVPHDFAPVDLSTCTLLANSGDSATGDRDQHRSGRRPRKGFCRSITLSCI